MTIFAIAIISTCLLFTALLYVRLRFCIVGVVGSSMAPTLHDGDKVVLFRIRSSRTLRRNQIVVFDLADKSRDLLGRDGSSIIKRIVAFPGDTIDTHLDDVSPDFRKYVERDHDAQGIRYWRIPEGHCFLRGDNSQRGLDSLIWGPLPISNIRGRVIRILGRGEFHRPTPQTPCLSIDIQGPEVGTLAPPFSLRRGSGEIVDETIFASHKNTLILFTCVSDVCREALNGVEALRENARRDDIHIIIVSGVDPSATELFVRDSDLSDFLYQDDGRFATDYHFTGMPFYCLVDTNGIVKLTGYPYFSSDTWTERFRTSISD